MRTRTKDAGIVRGSSENREYKRILAMLPVGLIGFMLPQVFDKFGLMNMKTSGPALVCFWQVEVVTSRLGSCSETRIHGVAGHG